MRHRRKPVDEPSATGLARRPAQEPEDLGHCQISHLYGLYPSSLINAEGTPDLFAADRAPLDQLLTHSDWSLAGSELPVMPMPDPWPGLEASVWIRSPDPGTPVHLTPGQALDLGTAAHTVNASPEG